MVGTVDPDSLATVDGYAIFLMISKVIESTAHQCVTRIKASFVIRTTVFNVASPICSLLRCNLAVSNPELAKEDTRLFDGV